MSRRSWVWRVSIAAAATLGVFAWAGTMAGARGAFEAQNGTTQFRFRSRNVIFFVGDGMGLSTVTAARVFSVGVAGQLVTDQFPYTAMKRGHRFPSRWARPPRAVRVGRLYVRMERAWLQRIGSG